MNNLIQKLKELEGRRIVSRVKHLRGRHDQRDHAWNRGMGRGDTSGGGGIDSAIPTMQAYQQKRQELLDDIRAGKITRADAREQLRQMRETAQGFVSRRQDVLGRRARGEPLRDTPWPMRPMRRVEVAPIGGLSRRAQSMVLQSQTQRLTPKAKTGEASEFAPMPIDASELMPGGQIYKAITENPEVEKQMRAQMRMQGGIGPVVMTPELTKALEIYAQQLASGDGFMQAVNNYQWMKGFEGRELRENLTDEQKESARQARDKFDAALAYQKDMAKKVSDARDSFSKAVEQGKMASMGTFIVPSDAKYGKIDEYMSAIPADTQEVQDFLRALSSDATELLRRKTSLDMGRMSGKSDAQLMGDQIYVDIAQEGIEGLRQQFMDFHQKGDTPSKFTTEELEQQFDELLNYFTDYAYFQSGRGAMSSIVNPTLQSLSNNVSRYYNPDHEMNRMLYGNSKLGKANAFYRYMLGDKGAINTVLEEQGMDEVIRQQKELVDTINQTMSFVSEWDKLGELQSISDVQSGMDFGELKSRIDEFASLDMQKVLDELPETSAEIPGEAKMKFFFEYLLGETSHLDEDAQAHVQRALALIYDMQSFNGTPTVAEWDDVLNPSTPRVTDSNGNPLVFWRSIKGKNWFDPAKEDRGLEYVEDMRTGETHYPGAGVSGFGTYMKTANVYGGSQSRDPITDTNEFVESTQSRAQATQQAADVFFDLLEQIAPQAVNPSVRQSFNQSVSDVRSYTDSIRASGQGDIGSAMQTVESQTGKTFAAISPMVHVDKRSEIGNFMFNLESTDLTPDQIAQLKSAYNAMMNHADALSDARKGYDESETLYHNAMATRNVYGEYTAGYSLNADARMPQTFVNKGNSGNDNHLDITSLDEQIIAEFERRYPMLAGNPLAIDVGIKMAMLGYDAYFAHLNSYSTNLVLLNRRVANISNTTLGPSTTEDDLRALIQTARAPDSAQR